MYMYMYDLIPFKIMTVLFRVNMANVIDKTRYGTPKSFSQLALAISHYRGVDNDNHWYVKNLTYPIYPTSLLCRPARLVSIYWSCPWALVHLGLKGKSTLILCWF